MKAMSFSPSKSDKSSIAIFTILLFHFAGLPFIAFEATRPFFLAATPFILMLSLSLLLWNHTDWSRIFMIFCAAVFIMGFGAEVVGVQTGILFGSYQYGTVLGWKLWGVPLVIGINWLLCIYSCGILANQFFYARLKNLKIPFLLSSILKALIGASLMLLLDVVLEPVAVKMEFWMWQNNHIPIWNYVTWFLLSFFLLILFEVLPFRKENKVAKTVYLTLFLFFGILNFV